MKAESNLPQGHVATKPAANMSAGMLDVAGVAAILVLTAIAYLAGANPLLERHGQFQKQHADLIARREELQKSQSSKADLQQQLSFVRLSMSGTPLRLQAHTLLNNRLAGLNETAIEVGAGLDDVVPGKNMEGARFDSLPIHVGGRGSFPAFTSLLHRLREESVDFAVSQFDISDAMQDGSGSGKFNLEILWYTEPSKRAVKGTERLDEGGAASAKGRP
jgi:Tfp pilus assembly protein PilO